MKKNQGQSTVKEQPPADPASMPADRLSFGKKVLFGLMTAALFFAGLELVLFLCGVQSVLTTEDPYVGFESRIPLFVERTGVDGQELLGTASNKMTYFNQQAFPKTKAPGAYRIFCLGGSTTHGRPYTDSTSFCGWLRELLPVADLTRKWELINAGGISYASYRITILMEELIQYEPDLFIVYSGHNEFLERRTYQDILETPGIVTGIVSTLSRTRSYSVMKRALDGLRPESDRPPTDRTVLPAEVDAILDNSVGLTAYTRDNRFQEQVVAHFRQNLGRMIDIARSAGAEIILVTPASKLRNCSPFKSENKAGLNDADRQRWEAFYRQAQEREQAGQWSEALAVLADAEAIDDQYADSFFLKGSILYELEQYEQAKAALRRARDEDICPVRALTSIVEAVAAVAAERDVALVDFVDLIDRRSDHSIPDEQSFLDHVHPTIECNRLLALALTDILIDREIVHPMPSWNDQAIAAVARSVEQRLDPEAHAMALLKLSKVLTWAGKFEEAAPLIAKASATLADNPECFYTLALTTAKAGDSEGAIRHYREALRLKPDYPQAHCNLGILLVTRGDVDEAIGHYRKAIQYKPDHAKAHNNLGAALAGKGQAAEAMKHCREAIRINPDLAEAHDNLGKILAGQEKLEAAAASYREALRIRPDYAPAHHHLANVLSKQGLLPDAVDHYRQALRVRPDFADGYGMLGGVLIRQGKTAEAAAQFRAALRLRPNWVEVANNLAWILATHESPQVRNGAEAVALAERACEATQGKMAGTLDTLAAAYAEASRFEDALRTARKALSLAREAQDQPLVRALEQRLTLYEAGKPYRDVP